MSKQFLNSMYYSIRVPNSQYGKDILCMIIKDSENGLKKTEFVENPTIPFYYYPDYKEKYQLIFVNKKDLREFKVKYKSRKYHMSKIVNMENEYSESKAVYYDYLRNNDGNYQILYDLKNKMWETENKLINHPQLYLSDINIEDYYKTMFQFKHGKIFSQLHKSFFDIEIRQNNYMGFPDPKLAPCPISLITFCDSLNKKLYGFALRDNNNPQIAEVEKDLSNFLIEIKESEEMALLKDYSFELFFYDEEITLIRGFFDKLHYIQPDFCGAWNAKFDILTIINRLKMMNLDPKNFFCEYDIPEKYKFCQFEEDNDDAKLFSRRWDWLKCVSKTQFYDMMTLYSILRKQVALMPSYSLDSISKHEIESNKVPLSSMGYNTSNVEKRNYKVFLTYGFKDTGLLDLIEQKTKDLDRLIIMSDNTRIRCFDKISYTIKNDIFQILYKEDKIIGSNVRYKTDEKIPGAIVASPNNLDSKGLQLYGNNTLIFDHVIDLDAKSEYPTIMIVANIIKDKIYGCIHEIYNGKNGIIMPRIKGDFNRKIMSLDSSILDIGEQYFGLPSIKDIFEQIENEFVKQITIKEG